VYEIKTSDRIKERRVLIDDMEVTIKPLGAGTQLEFSRLQRRMDFLDKKMKAGTLTESDLDQMDQYEDKLLGMFSHIIRDGSEDNAKVKAWLDRTPLEDIQYYFEEMQRQFQQNDVKKVGDEATTTPTAA
jgi:hypothetical protein